MTLVRRHVRLAAVALAVAAVGWRLATLIGDGSGFARPIVLVSGRDDHGLVATATVDLLDAPEGGRVGAVADGTLVQVLAEESTWLRVRTLEGDRDLEGWVDDFHLRGTVHVVGDPPACPVPAYGEPGTGVLAVLEPSQQVELHDHHVVDGTTWVAVRPVSGGELVLVERHQVRELPGPRPEPGVPCEEVTADPEARPHRH